MKKVAGSNLGTSTVTMRRADLVPKPQPTAKQLLTDAQRAVQPRLSADEEAMLARMRARRQELRNG
jgi:hypothetical protein